MSYLSIVSGRFGSVTTRENCEAILPNGEFGCALAAKASSVEGALDLARTFMSALSDDAEDRLPDEIKLGKDANGHAEGICIHASRLACATLIRAIDAGKVSVDDAVLAVQWTVAAGYGSQASVSQDPKDQPVTIRRD